MSPSHADKVSYYITQIEKKLETYSKEYAIESKILQTDYDALFDERDDNKFLRSLRVFNERMNKLIDEAAQK